MRHLKQFDDFIKEGIVKRVSINRESAKSLIRESERKMRSIKLQLEKIGVIEDNANEDQLRYFRNGILYYGTSLDKEYADKVLEFTNKTHPKLKELLKL